MSLAYDTGATPEYATRTEIHYMCHRSMAQIAKAIRDGKLALHLIDGKIQINVAEAKALFCKESNLFG